MDYQNRAGSKFGGGGVAGLAETNAHRRDRLRKLALETIDLSKDPYHFQNHQGQYECKLCLTSHSNDGSYLAHTQGRKHQMNLERRAAQDAKHPKSASTAPSIIGNNEIKAPKSFIPRIGLPSHKVTKFRDPSTQQVGLLVQVQYPQIGQNIIPRYRYLGAFEQKIEGPDKDFQYLVIAADPYNSIAIKLHTREVDRDSVWSHWDSDSKEFFLQFHYRQ
jgi:splicing factor 3A subunit 2